MAENNTDLGRIRVTPYKPMPDLYHGTGMGSITTPASTIGTTPIFNPSYDSANAIDEYSDKPILGGPQAEHISQAMQADAEAQVRANQQRSLEALTTDESVTQRINNARAIANTAPEPRTPEAQLVESGYSNLPAEDKSALIDSLQRMTGQEVNDKAQVQNLGYDPETVSLKDVLQTEDPKYAEIAQNIIDTHNLAQPSEIKSNMQNLLRYIQMVPLNPQVNADIEQWIQGNQQGNVDFGKSWFNFNKLMTQKYGDKWGIQAGAYALSHAAIDLAVIMAAMAVLPETVVLGALASAIYRIGAVTVGSGLVGGVINTLAGMKAAVPHEMFVQGVGQLGGEFLGAAAKGIVNLVKGGDSAFVAASKASAVSGNTRIQRRMAANIKDAINSGEPKLVSRAERLTGIDIKDLEIIAINPSSGYTIKGPSGTFEVNPKTAEARDWILDNIGIAKSISPEDRAIIHNSIMLRVMSENALVAKMVKNGRATLDVAFDHEGFQFSPPSLVNNKKPSWFLDMVTPPGFRFGKAVGNDLNAAHNQEAFLEQAMQRSFRAVLKDLDVPSLEKAPRVIKALQYGHENQKFLTPNDLEDLGLTSKEVGAYYTIRDGLDRLWAWREKFYVNKFQQAGYKQTSTGDIVQVNGKADEYGVVNVVPIRSTLGRPLQAYRIPEAALKDVTSVVGYVPGYLPIRYTAPYHISVIDTKNGTIQRLHTADRRSDAAKFVAENEQKMLAEGKIVYFDRWHENAQAYDFGMPAGNLKFMDALSDKQLNAIRTTAEKAGLEFNPEQLALVYEHLNWQGKANVRTGQRAANRLTDVKTGKVSEMKPVSEAIANYYSMAARERGSILWREHYTREFKDVAVKKGILKYNEPWNTPKEELSANSAMASDMKWFLARQKDLMEINTYRTSAERAFYDKFQTVANKMVEWDNPAGKAFARVLDNRFADSLIGNFNRYARQTSFYSVLAFNPSQLFIQLDQVARLVFAKSIHPVTLTQALFDYAALAGGTVARKFGAQLSKDSSSIFNAAQRSGFIADRSLAELGDYHYHISNSILAAPMTLPESMIRGLSFTIARREHIDALKAGKLLGIDGTPFKGSIDNAEFLQLVANKAKDYALDMTSSGQLRYTKGFLGTALQFTSWFPKTVRFMYGSDTLTLPERIACSTGAFAFYGTLGLPLIADMTNGIEWVHRQFDSALDQAEFARDFFKDMADPLIKYVEDTYGKDSTEAKDLRRLQEGKAPHDLNLDGLIARTAPGLMISQIAESYQYRGLAAVPIMGVLGTVWQNVKTIAQGYEAWDRTLKVYEDIANNTTDNIPQELIDTPEYSTATLLWTITNNLPVTLARQTANLLLNRYGEELNVPGADLPLNEINNLRRDQQGNVTPELKTPTTTVYDFLGLATSEGQQFKEDKKTLAKWRQVHEDRIKDITEQYKSIAFNNLALQASFRAQVIAKAKDEYEYIIKHGYQDIMPPGKQDYGSYEKSLTLPMDYVDRQRNIKPVTIHDRRSAINGE